MEALCYSFPNLFNLATNKEAKVAEIWDSRERFGCWSPTFLRSLNDWELEEMTIFLRILHGHNFHPSGVDKLSMKNANNKGFSVKSMYKGFDVSLALDFPHCLVLESGCSPKNWSLCLGSGMEKSAHFGSSKTSRYDIRKQMFHVRGGRGDHRPFADSL